MKNKKIKTGSTNTNAIIDLRISENKKYANNGQWFKDYLETIIPYDQAVVQDYKEMLVSYSLLTNDFTGYQKELASFCNEMGEEEFTPEFLKPDPLLPFNQIPNKFNVIIGGLLKRNEHYKPLLLSSKAIKDKNSAQTEEIRNSILEQAELQVQLEQMSQQGASEKDLKKFQEEYVTQQSPEDIASKNFLSEWEVFNSHALKFCYNSENIKEKQTRVAKHALASARMFWKVGWNYGRPTIEIVNPLYAGFHKSPDELNVSKGDFFWNKKAITIADAYQKYGDILKKEDFEKLKTYSESASSFRNKEHDVVGGNATYVFDKTFQNAAFDSTNNLNKKIGQNMGEGSTNNISNLRLLWETHLEIKAFRRILFLTSFDETGEAIVEIVDDKYEIPKDATKIKFINKYLNTSTKYKWTDELGDTYEAEPLYIPRRYEIIRLGQDVYPYFREVPNQPLSIENPYRDFELSYKGGLLDNLNSKSISPIQRATPSVFQYMQIKRIILRETAKYQGFITDIDVDQIPDYLSMDEDGIPIPGLDKVAVWSMYVKKLGKNFYSGSQTAGGALPSTRSPGSKSAMTGTAIDLINLSNLLELVNREIGMAMGVSPEREGSFTQGSNVTDNQQSIQQSYDITEPFYQTLSFHWKEVFNDWLKLWRIYCKNIFESNPKLKEHFVAYVTPNGTEELFKITPDILDNEALGLFVSNSGQDQRYRDMMTQHSAAFAQGKGEGTEVVSAMLKSIVAGDSPEEIHKMIIVESKKQSDRLAQAQQAQQEQEAKMQEREIESREDKQAHEIELQKMKGDNLLEQKSMDIFKFQDDLNKDQDGVNDALENLIKVKQMNDDTRKLNQEDAKIQLKSKEIDNKRASDKESAKNKVKTK